MLPRWRFGEGEVVLLATLQGLVAERDRVRAALREEAPAIVAIGLSPESVASLLRFERDPEHDPFDDLPDHDFVYSRVLATFGDVDLPPPDLLEAARHAKAEGARLLGVDLSEEAYETMFTKEVSVWGFLRYGRIQRRLAKRPPRAADARAFSLAWDARIRKVKGIARIEAARERHMAQAVAALAREERAKVVLLVDAPREAGVAGQLAAASTPSSAPARK